MIAICKVCRKPLATEADHAEFEAIDWCAPTNGTPDDYRLDLCWSEYAGGEHLDANGELIEDELEHVIGQRDAAEAEVARLKGEYERGVRDAFEEIWMGLGNREFAIKKFLEARADITAAEENHRD